MPESPRIFISYAHRDGGDLAEHLQRDLEALGFDAWRDKKRLKAGDRWTKAIEAELDAREVVLALLSDGSFASDTCRAEQGWALDAGKRVIPVKVHRHAKAQLRLHGLLWLDFSDLTKYAERLEELAESLGKLGRLPACPTRRYNNSPPLPANFVDRPELLAKLRDALFEEAPNRNIALTALHGMGGIGKTVLAQALCQDKVLLGQFVGRSPWTAADALVRQRQPTRGSAAGEGIGVKIRISKTARVGD